MKTLNLYLTFILMIGLSLNAFTQSWQFAKSFGGVPGSNIYKYENNKPWCMEVDDEGNTYVCGIYGALTQINDSTLPYYNDGSSGSFIVKYNCAGEVLWHKAIANTENKDENIQKMLLKDNYLYVIGSLFIDSYSRIWWLDTLVQGFNIPYPYEYPWNFSENNYILKMDLDGNIVENHRLSFEGTPGNYRSSPTWGGGENGFVVDNEGCMYIYARYPYENTYTLLKLDNQVVSDTLYFSPGKNHLLIKLDADFNLLWYKSIIQGAFEPNYGGSNIEFFDMRVDSNNDLYAVGKIGAFFCADTVITHVDLGNNQILTTYGNIDKTEAGFLLKMNSEGEVLWTQQTKQFFTGFGSFASFNSLILDESNQKIYISGIGDVLGNNPYFEDESGTILGENDTIFNMDFEISSGNMGFIAQYSMDGEYHWFRMPYTPECQIRSIDMHDNQIYTAVKWFKTLEHQENSYEMNLQNGQALTICAWDTEGNPTSSINIPSTCADFNYNVLVPFDLRLNNRGEISVSGTYKQSLTFGEDTIYAQGSNKMFVAKYGKACPVLLEENGYFCYGDTYRDSTLWQSGNYQFIVETPSADSVINLNATVHPQITSGLNDTVAYIGENLYLECTNTNYDAYQWSTGSNTYFENLMFNNTGTETVYITITDSICSATDTIHININTSGIEETEKSTAIYPNPAGSVLNIDGKGINLQSYTISDLNGKILLKGSNRTVNINNLPPGSYLIRLIDTENKVYYIKFIKL